MNASILSSVDLCPFTWRYVDGGKYAWITYEEVNWPPVPLAAMLFPFACKTLTVSLLERLSGQRFRLEPD
jgi:hypothetical protein